MPDWSKLIPAEWSALELILTVGALIAVIIMTVKLWPALSRFVRVVNALTALPAFIDRTDDTIERLRAQVENDHDENLRDELTALAVTAKRTEEAVAGVHGRLDQVASKQDALVQWQQEHQAAAADGFARLGQLENGAPDRRGLAQSEGEDNA